MRISDWSSDVWLPISPCASRPSKPASIVNPGRGSARATTRPRGCGWQRDSRRCRCRCFQLPRIQPTLAMPADPEGAAHGCAAFFARAGCPLEKSLHQRKARFALGTKRFSLLPFLLTLIKRNEVAETERTCTSDLALSEEKNPKKTEFHPP